MLYPKVFPNLAAYKKPREDLAAILMTGIPAGIVPGFQNYTGKTPADMLRLNVAIPPAETQAAGRRGRRSGRFPQWSPGRDDVLTVEIRAIAGVTIPLVDKTFTPDGAAAKVTDGVTPPAVATSQLPLSWRTARRL